MLAGLPALPSPEEAATVLLNDERARQAAGDRRMLQEYAREALDRGDISLGCGTRRAERQLITCQGRLLPRTDRKPLHR
jgi:hypothetical protein